MQQWLTQINLEQAKQNMTVAWDRNQMELSYRAK